MATVVNCQCGARLRLPEDAAGKSFRCPRCKAMIAVPPVEARILAASAPRAGTPGATCPICQSGLVADDAVIACSDCDQVHHQECWQEVGGCATYGCPQAPAATKEAAAAAPRSAWGDTKACPACGETIRSIAVKCRYCGEMFETVDPLKAADLRRGARKAETLRSMRTTVTVLFILSLVGCLAPLTLILSLIYLVPKRELVADAGPLFRVLGYSTVGLSVLYCLLILVFLILPS